MKEKIREFISREVRGLGARVRSLGKISLPSASIFNPRNINYLLVTLSGIFFLYLMADVLVLSRWARVSDPVALEGSATAGETEEAAQFGDDREHLSEKKMKPFSHYENVIRRRNIFKPTPAMAREKAETPKRAIRLGELAENLSVSGIFLDQTPQAIIADRGGSKTWFVTEGQYINDILVKKIEKGKVTLAYKDEEMELLF